MNSKYTVRAVRRRTNMALTWLNSMPGFERKSVTTFTRKNSSASHGRTSSL